MWGTMKRPRPDLLRSRDVPRNSHLAGRVSPLVGINLARFFFSLVALLSELGAAP